MKRLVLVALAMLGTLALTAKRAAGQEALRQRRAFPHERHAKLFPTCTACHAGATTGNPAQMMPPPASCAECHNGVDSKRVRYDAPVTRHDFLRFSHAEHGSQVAKEGRECTACHGAKSAAPGMEVVHASPASCQGCHAHRTSDHFAPESRCTTCHIALARTTTLTVDNIAAIPRPRSHESARFIGEHAVSTDTDIAQCATCHARESCSRCHVNAASVSAIGKLLPDARVAALMRGKSATYFTPDDHRVAAWESSHGGAAESGTQRCAACHARPSCTVCHTGAMGQSVIRRLPDGRTSVPGVQLVPPRRVSGTGGVAAVGGIGRVGAPQAGAVLTVQAPRAAGRIADTTRTIVRVHAAGFERAHAGAASAGRLTCEGCHAQRFCSDCHAGETRRRFHAANFVVRHAPESYGRDQECQSCHNTEVFCRSCHQASGLASEGRLNRAYHNAQPLWLLQHGRAARQGLESCVTCHKQRDCMQCHATTGWGINPHGPDFDAKRVGARARVMCARCHITDPTKGR